jgi:hypothetical protein
MTIAAVPHPGLSSPSGSVLMRAPNIVSVQHWDRLLGGLLYATSPMVDWASLLRRSFSVDVLECPKCHGRLRIVAVITEREPIRRILANLGMATEAPPLAHARDPRDDQLDVDSSDQLEPGWSALRTPRNATKKTPLKRRYVDSFAGRKPFALPMRLESVVAACGDEAFSYAGGNSPRKKLTRGVYTSTEYPESRKR